MKNNPVRFILLSGVGWLTDLSCMTFLVYLGYEPMLANIVSASIAVSLVYWVSRLYIFDSSGNGRALIGFFYYYTYSIVIIFLFSTVIQYISYFLHGKLHQVIPFSITALIAKILTTPFNLYINFLVSKYIIGKT